VQGQNGVIDRPAIYESLRFLKIYLCSQSGNESLPSNAAHIGIVLNHRLDQERSVIQQYIQREVFQAAMPGSRNAELRLFRT
jgi:hypothetical protein